MRAGTDSYCNAIMPVFETNLLLALGSAESLVRAVF